MVAYCQKQEATTSQLYMNAVLGSIILNKQDLFDSSSDRQKNYIVSFGTWAHMKYRNLGLEKKFPDNDVLNSYLKKTFQERIIPNHPDVYSKEKLTLGYEITSKMKKMMGNVPEEVTRAINEKNALENIGTQGN
jgi:hypothetical protein